MAAQENKARVLYFLDELFNRKNVDAVEQLASASIAAHFNRSSATFQFLSAFPDLELTIDDVLTDGEWVVCRSSWRATHRGPYLHLGPTGKRVSGRRTDTFRVVNNIIVEAQQHWDALSLIQQLEAGRASKEVQAQRYEEPVLAVNEIQGNVLPGFHTRFQTLLFVTLTAPKQAQRWLLYLMPHITTLAEVLAARRSERMAQPAPVWLNIVFSYGGLHKLSTEAQHFTDPAFKEGMPQRSVLLGDPGDHHAEGNCRNWVVGALGTIPDLCLLVASDDPMQLHDMVRRIEGELPHSLHVAYKQQGAAPPPPRHEYEHSGFRDNISQPGVRGRLSATPDDLLTPRHDPLHPHEGKPGQTMIWPGEFVFGYPGQDPLSKHKPSAVANAGPTWGRNGSFLVIRRLRQNLDGFRTFVASTTTALAAQHPSLRDLTPDQLAAKLMGRWPSGAPLTRAPNGDNAALAHNNFANNDFRYVRPRPPLVGETAEHHAARAWPPAPADDVGLMCPHAAHVRRAYPRDDATADISEAQIETHRLLRRGIPYEASPGEPYERGLLFMAYQTSIERQFEFVTRGWLNNPHFRDNGDGYDPIAGQHSEGRGTRQRYCTIPIQNAEGSITRIMIDLPFDWSIPTGGGYFFAPAISALRYLATCALPGTAPHQEARR